MVYLEVFIEDTNIYSIKWVLVKQIVSSAERGGSQISKLYSNASVFVIEKIISTRFDAYAYLCEPQIEVKGSVEVVL